MSKEHSIFNVDSEYGVDSRYKTTKEREYDSVALMQARLERLKNLPKEQILRAKLVQLKLKMENYLKEFIYDNQNHFAHFLESYVDVIYSKRSEFAKDINVTPVYLSKVINGHREPNEEFILKLMVHSEKMFKHVSVFESSTWYKIYFHEKLCDTMSNEDRWRPEIERQVRLTELIVQ
ncbi:MAG: helix-turn-helix transcriptional regulator [Saprospiraceae bacterium]